MNEYKAFMKYLKPFRKIYVLIILLVIISTACSLPLPLVTKQIIDDAIPHNNTSLLNQLVLVVVFLYLLRTVIEYILTYTYTYLGTSVSLEIRKELIIHMQNLPLQYINKHSSGEMASRIMNDVGSISNLFTSSIIDAMDNLVTSIVIFFILININWKLTLISVSVIPVFIVVSMLSNKKIRFIGKEVQNQSATILGGMFENITNLKIVKAFNSEKYFFNKIVIELKKLINLQLLGTKINAFIQQFTFFIVMIAPILVIWYGSKLILERALTLGALFAFYQYVAQIFSPIKNLVSFNSQIQSSWGAISRITEFFNIKCEDKNEGQQLINFNGNVEFKNVYFKYDNDKKDYIIKNLSFKIKSGEFIGIVGQSGSGKTTIVNLIMKFYKASRGNIYIDNLNILDISTSSLLNNIGIVTQEPYIFKGTIEENIRIAKTDATLEEIMEAAKLSQIDEFIKSLPMKYNTILEERGTNISGGQKQRITIARIFLKKPKVIIFDEATSSLDSNIESIIQNVIEKRLTDSTCIVITHKLSTIKNADRIYVINDGEMVEEGTDSELIKNNGLYSSLKMYSEYLSNKNKSEIIKIEDYRKSIYMLKENEELKRLKVIGHSMEPTIIKGALIELENKFSNVSIGDIITFINKDHLTTHRVINISNKGSKKVYVTKGDYNVFEKEFVYEEDIIGKVINYINPEF